MDITFRGFLLKNLLYYKIANIFTFYNFPIKDNGFVKIDIFMDQTFFVCILNVIELC